MDSLHKIRSQLYALFLRCISKIDPLRAALVVLAVVGSLAGTTLGYLVAQATMVPPAPMEWVEEIGYRVPVLTLETYTDQELTLRTDALGTRFVMGEKILSAPPMTTFRLVLDPALRVVQTGTTLGEKSPSTACSFVAGTTGKYVYPAEDARAKRLKTRRCFDSLQAAQEAGLLVPEK